MKNNARKKLAFRAETIRLLDRDALRRVAGGGDDSIYMTVCLVGACRPTGEFDCAGSALCPDGGGGGSGSGGSIGSGITNEKCVRTD